MYSPAAKVRSAKLLKNIASGFAKIRCEILKRMKTKSNQLLSPGALAARWSYHPESIRRLIRSGKLEAIRLGRRLRISLQAIEKMEDDGRIKRSNGTL